MRLSALLGFVLGVLPLCCPAEYYSFNTAKGADSVMLEVRWPYWAEHTYNALISQKMTSSDHGNCYFYGGITFADPGYPAKGGPANILWSFWPPTGTVNQGDAIKAFYTAPDMWAPPHIGEGASGKVMGAWPALQTNQWYRFALRVWQPADGTPHVAYIGQWLRLPDSGTWYHIATMKIPFAATGMTPLGGFLEDPAHGNRLPRRADFRNVYSHLPGGMWEMANRFTPSTRQATEKGTASLIENGTATFFETCSGADYKNYNLGPGKAEVSLVMTNQPPAPVFDSILVEKEAASLGDQQLAVQWQIPPTSSPQLSYKIEVFDNPACTGSPIATAFDYDPEAREKLLAVPALANAGVRLTITDIFGNTSKPILIQAAKTAPSPAAQVTGSVPGIAYKYYEAPGDSSARGHVASWTKVPGLDTLKPMGQGAVDYPDLSVRQRRYGYALDYAGYIRIPATGIYEFTLRSCSGGVLLIDDRPVVDGDGHHSPSDAKGWVALQAGLHPVELRYYFDTASSLAGGFIDSLSLSYEGPGLSKRPVPFEAWQRVPTGPEPTIALTSPEDHSTVNVGDLVLKAAVEARGVTPEKVQFYEGDSYLGEKSEAPYSLPFLLGAAPDYPIRARLLYDNGASADSPVHWVTVGNPSLDPWKLAAIGERTRPAGAAAQNGVYSLTGDGLNFINQPSEGDCTLVAHLADITGKEKNPDGTSPGKSWSAGLMMRSSLAAKPGSELGGDNVLFVTVFGTVSDDTRFEDITMGNLGGHFPSKGLGAKNTWLKLERMGNTFITSISTDGAHWSVANTQILKNAPPSLYVGLFTYAPTSQDPAIHHAAFDQVSLTGKPASSP